ncbi:MAG TPA: CcmD family protein [Bryobacteraceae bacterium]|nr:CcmD family protein [Bryobacteraceae bacterium]
MENLNWLFYAYGIGWLVIFGYLFQISRKEHSLRKRIADLQEMIEDRWKKKA